MAELQDSAGSGRRVDAQGSSDAYHLVVHTCSETSESSFGVAACDGAARVGVGVAACNGAARLGVAVTSSLSCPGGTGVVDSS